MDQIEDYHHIRSGGSGYYEQKRGLTAVWGKEAVQFLDGLITNDMKTLEDGVEMLAAFPNAQGRLLVAVRVQRQGDRFLFETEDATREKLFQNLFRFTYARDFFVEDLSDQYRYFDLFGDPVSEPGAIATGFLFNGSAVKGLFAPIDIPNEALADLIGPAAVKITDDVYEVLRIENGIPKYGVDMDETTIAPELGIDGLISYNKGCYIGQEIIARIHFRGHVAKRLTGLMSEPGAIATGFSPNEELTTPDGKNAGRVTSVTFSPQLGRNIALAYVRYAHLAEGTDLMSDGKLAVVKNLPFV